MSKKKAFSGSTMTLKDFHGGSIPSDLPLPSAPGVTMRSSDRAGLDRSSAWANPIGRSDHRLRPVASPAAKNFDDKTPFLAPTARIGRNFDEDERKPLDGGSGPRRTVCDESIYPPPNRMELKLDSYSARLAETTHTGVSSGRQSFSPMCHLPNASTGTLVGRHAEATHSVVNSQNLGGSSGSAVTGSHPNAWAARKEVLSSTEPVTSSWSGPAAFSKLVQASALEKVSSGRWQSKQSPNYRADVEVIQYSETDSGLHSMGSNNDTCGGMDVRSGREYSIETLARHAERVLTVEDGSWVGGKELPGSERVGSPLHLGAKERNPPVYGNGILSAGTDEKFGKLDLQAPVPSEASERPKLKLLPRSKPLENLEPPSVVDHKQGYQQLGDCSDMETATELHGNFNHAKPGSAGTENGNRLVERPKLNLKPRSQPVDQSEKNIERERKTLFGGARPRELVLKERGVDDVADDGPVRDNPPNRVKHDVAKTEAVSGRVAPVRYSEKADNLPLDHRIGKTTEKKDHRVDAERADTPKRNWRNDTWRTGRETEKQQQPPESLQERERSPESWRKPIEQQPKPASPDTSGVRYGKIASAAELAQAFSKSISDPKSSERLSGQRNLPGLSQVPFSRLMGPTSRPRINGY